MGHYIWCERDTHTIKKTGGDGKVRSLEVANSIGPNQPINLCIYMECECEELWNRIEELANADGN